ncbi:hypothetical protein NFI96_011598 [Prochilodus magdalenae]|nr:hypothetical protein NFI96_011598 [Prochilodus magdalenae]
MENYKMTAVDIETGTGDVYKATVESGKPSRNWIWNIIGVVFLIVLCSAASFFFAWHFTSGSKREFTAEEQSNPTTAHHHQMLTKIANSTKAAIHLHVSTQGKTLQWVNGVDQSFSAGGLKLENNQIVIPSDGLYFVYSQASFHVPCLPDQELSYSVWWSSHSISFAERSILNGVKSACQTSTEEEVENGKYVYEVIYLGAVFRLYKGDKLSTDTEQLEYIEKQSSKTFFGVFEL